MSTTTPNMHWIQEATFKNPGDPNAPATLLYVTAAIDDPTGPVFSYGTIANQNGVNTQTDLGAADSGQIVGNQIIIRLSVDKVNAAVGYNVVGTTATATQAKEHWMMVLTTKARFERALRSSVSVPRQSSFVQKWRTRPEGPGFG